MDQVVARSIVNTADDVGRHVAAKFASAVDSAARFPSEAIAELKARGFLGLLVPREFGGAGAEMHDVVAACSALGRYCSSTAMIFAMHHIQVACLAVAHERRSWHQAFLRRVAAEQLLLASATSEDIVGGDIRSSVCAVTRTGSTATLQKAGTIISYARHADAILITARREPGAVSSDQVLLVALKAQCALDLTSPWDALGMRGTCSDGFRLTAQVPVEQICPVSFSDIAALVMLPASHLMWSGVWHGIATDAVVRAQAFLRARARRNLDAPLPGSTRLAEAAARLQMLAANIAIGVQTYQDVGDCDQRRDTARHTIAMNNLKVTSSRLAVEIIQNALMVCGIAGYRNDSPYSLSRHLRDATSALLMINNDRIEQAVARMLLVSKIGNGLSERSP